MAVRVAAADVSGLDTQRSLWLVGEARRQKVLRLRSESARRQSLGIGLLAKMLLEEEELSEELLTYSPDAPGRLQGKPALPAETGRFISMSHAGRIAVCVLSDTPAGVDAEEERRVHQALLRREFSPEDAGRVNASADPARAFLRLWTAKESLFKAGGVWADAKRTVSEAVRAGGFVLHYAEIGEAPRAFLCLCTREGADISGRFGRFLANGGYAEQRNLIFKRGEP